MKHKFLKSNLIIILGIFLALNLSAQENGFPQKDGENFKESVILYNDANYYAAYWKLTRLKQSMNENDPFQSEIDYYMAMCMLKLDKKRAEAEAQQYINNYPKGARTNQMKYDLAEYLFQKKKYRTTLRTMNTIDVDALSKSLQNNYTFIKGYCLFDDKKYEEAGKLFFKMRNSPSIYATAANYYWGYINYIQGNTETALIEFTKLESHPQFKEVIPYYIAQIYYVNERYEKAIEYATNIQNQGETENINELYKIIGDANYELKNYKAAIASLKQYEPDNKESLREFHYRLGFSHYKIENYQEAIDNLQKVVNKKDEISQNAWFILADSYLKTDDKKKARPAFERASKMDFDARIQEDALFNYAKLTYELSYSPFNETIKAFDTYLSKYPESNRNDAAFDYLVKVYMSTKNYGDAINSIEKIKNPTPAIKEALQRVTYYRGLELYNDGSYLSAVKYFEKSLENAQYNRKYKAQALYWKAEAAYKTGQFELATNEFNQFLNTPGAFSLPEYGNAYYNIGYCYFKQKKYDEAQSWFRKYLSLSNKKEFMAADCYNRIGDCFYLKRDFEQSAKYYQLAIESNTYDADYAYYRLGMQNGIMKNYPQKIEKMRMVINSYPKSSYRDDALYEIARTRERLNQTQQAESDYKDLLGNYSQSGYASKALLQLGLINFNKGDHKKSLNYYKMVVSNHLNSEDGQAALQGIKNNYIEMNNVDGYIAYMAGLKGGGNMSTSEQDSLFYSAAEKQYMSGDSNAIKQFENYLSRYPQGAFSINANYYIGESLYQSGAYTKSLQYFMKVLDGGDNIFTESALVKAGELNLNAGKFDTALKNYLHLDKVANTQWNTLKARAGAMRSYAALKKHKQTIEWGMKLLDTEKVTELMVREAKLKIAKAYHASEQNDKALEYYTQLYEDVKSIEGAEAKYQMAALYQSEGKTKKAEEQIMDFISKGTPHQYWLAKSFILLSDVYLAEKDTFQARHTLKSVIDNYTTPEDGIINEARTKLIELGDEESQDTIAPQP